MLSELLNERFVRRYGSVGSSFGQWLWSRDRWKTGQPVSILLTDDEFWSAAEHGGGGGIRPEIELLRHPIVLATPASIRATAIVGRAASKCISQQIDSESPDFLEMKQRKFDTKTDKRSWMAALDWYGLYRSDFHFYRLVHPFRGTALTIDRFSGANGWTSFDDTMAVAVADEELHSVEGGGPSWTITLAGGRSVILESEVGLRVQLP